MPADEWYEVRITDDGQTIAVHVEGSQIHRGEKDVPAISVKYPGKLKGRRIAIYNREFVGGVSHESHIDNFVVNPLAPSK